MTGFILVAVSGIIEITPEKVAQWVVVNVLFHLGLQK